ncbi:MAG: hypothetical protein ABFS56_27640 [Pseudomonadota bacterium]
MLEAKKRHKNGYQLALLLRDHNLDEVLQRGGLMNVVGRENIYYIHACPFYEADSGPKIMFNLGVQTKVRTSVISV